MIKSAIGKTLHQGPKLQVLYHLDNELAKNEAYHSFMAIKVHKKLRHISHKALRHLLKHGMFQGRGLNSIGNKITCNACIKSKITCKPLPKDSMTDKKLYYVSFIDYYSTESVSHLISSKDQVFSKYKLYKAMMLQQRNVCIKILFSD